MICVDKEIMKSVVLDKLADTVRLMIGSSRNAFKASKHMRAL